MRVFVTGGTGFVGGYVVRELLRRGHEVHLGVRNPAKARKLFGDSVKVHEVQFIDRESIKSALSEAEPDAIVHLIGILYEIKRKGITFENIHYMYSLNLYDVAKDLGIKRVLHMSALGTHDDAPSRYHQTKRWAEKHLMDSGLDYTIFRPSMILGPGQRLFADMDKITRIIPVVALPGGGSYRFQPVDVRDVAECFATALDKDEAKGKIYELCGSKTVSFKGLLKSIFSFLSRRVLMIPLPIKLMYYRGRIVETFIEPPPFSSDQMLMMWRENVCGIIEGAISDGVKVISGRDPIPYEESLRWSLEGYRAISSSK